MPPGILSNVGAAWRPLIDSKSRPGSLAVWAPICQGGLNMDIDDDVISPVLRVEEYDDFPRESAVTLFAAQQAGVILPSVQSRVSASERAIFLATLPTRVQVKLNQPFGKDNIVQCFQSEACLRLVLLPLYKSGFLSRSTDWSALAVAYREANKFLALIKDHADVDFRPLQGYNVRWNSIKTIDNDRVRMATAALLHFDGDVADVVRWIGGPHVGANRDIDASLAYLRGIVAPGLCDSLERMWRHGSPAVCNASATDQNFQEYKSYGNHATVTDEPEVTYSTLLKDSARGYCVLFDKRAVDFTLNCHVTPIGLVDHNNPHKNARPIFDASFRPEPWCSGINDWTTKTTEPSINFADALDKYFFWLYNLRITYPDEEIYLGDDDVSGAFRHQKYHPNLVGMHTCVLSGYMSVSTGLTFGDTTSPANFDPIAETRKALAKYLWKQPDTVAQAAVYLPRLELANPMTPTEIADIVPAQADLLNQGVLDSATGQRLPPQFDHHVDDDIYADVASFMPLTVSSSALALWQVLGFPNPLHGPNVLSQEKFDGRYTHQRKTLGYWVDSRRMEVAALPAKRALVADSLREWCTCRTHFTLRDISSIHGSLENMTRHVTWMRPLFFALQNAIRVELNRRYYVLQRMYPRTGRAARLQAKLPATLYHRLSSLIARDKASLLWTSQTQMNMTQHLRAAFAVLHGIVGDEAQRIAQPLGFIVPRVPHAVSTGDASEYGGGAHCASLCYWFDITWSDRVKQGTQLKPSEPGFIHINCLEFIVVVLQLAAFTVRLRTLSAAQHG